MPRAEQSRTEPSSVQCRHNCQYFRWHRLLNRKVDESIIIEAERHRTSYFDLMGCVMHRIVYHNAPYTDRAGEWRRGTGSHVAAEWMLKSNETWLHLRPSPLYEEVKSTSLHCSWDIMPLFALISDALMLWCCDAVMLCIGPSWY